MRKSPYAVSLLTNLLTFSSFLFSFSPLGSKMLFFRYGKLSLPLFWFLILQAIAESNAPCYSPAGTEAAGFFPCDPTAYITACCPMGWTCFSNSLCIVTDPHISNDSLALGTTIRAACTNPKWNNAVCGGFCLGENSANGFLVIA